MEKKHLKAQGRVLGAEDLCDEREGSAVASGPEPISDEAASRVAGGASHECTYCCSSCGRIFSAAEEARYRHRCPDDGEEMEIFSIY